MARIACQVLHRSRRITFIWSEGAAAFEPYHLEGDERQRFLALTAQVHAALAQNAGDLSALAPLGHQLYRDVFRVAAVQTWFAELAQSNRIESLEFLGDDPAAFPWNVLCDEPTPDRFFGVRFNLGVGRRVNPIRAYTVAAAAAQLVAADAATVERLNESQRGRLNSWRDGGTLVSSATGLTDALKQTPADILVLLVRFEQGQAYLGDEAFSAADLYRWMQDSPDSNPDPAIILLGTGPAVEQAEWQTFVSSATCTLSGLIANEVLLPADQLIDVGLNLAQQFARGEKSLGEELRSLRAGAGVAGQAISAFCPPEWRVLRDEAAPAVPSERVPLPEEPFHPFGPYEASDRPLFVGREEETIRCATLLDQASACCMLVHGGPAFGKTSFLQAGLLPYLEHDNIGYRTLRDRSPLDTPAAERDYPVLLLRCTGDLAGQFADALMVFCAQPLTYSTPTGAVVTVDLPGLLRETVTGTSPPGSTAIQSAETTTGITAEPGEADAETPTGGLTTRDLWIALRDQKDLLARVLDAITKPLPFELVIVVDQGEELLTLVRSPQQQARRQKALDMLARVGSSAARCKIVYAIRTQNLGQLISLLPGGRLPGDWHTFNLGMLTENQMADALLWPTQREEIPHTDEVPFQKYGFNFADGLAHEIVAKAVSYADDDRQSPLPLLQAIGGLLYEEKVVARRQPVVTMADLNELGGVRFALVKQLDRALQRLSITRKSRDSLRDLICRMHTSHVDGTLSRDLIPASRLAKVWKPSGQPPEEVVNKAAEQEGLLEIQQLFIGGEHEVYLSLPQDSLAQLGETIEAQDLRKLVRTRVVDTLWIMIPLMCLAAALTFFFTRGRAGGDERDAEIVKQFNEFEEKANKKIRQIAELTLLQTLDKVRPSLYAGQLAQADQAMLAGNALRARQLLLSQPATRSYTEYRKATEKKKETEEKLPTIDIPDLRGFEWRYLWKKLNSERHNFEGHRSVVQCVAVSPDNRWAASGSTHDGSARTGAREGPIRIWDLVMGRVVAVVGDPRQAVTIHALAFSPDGKTLASGGTDKAVRLWDVSSLKGDFVEIAKESKTLSGHGDTVHALAFKDNQTLASGGADKSVIVWDVPQGSKKHTLAEHGAAVHALAFVDGATLVSAGAESQLLVWDADAGKKRHAIKTPYRAVFALAANEKTVATGGVEGRGDADLGVVRFWDVAGSKETGTAIEQTSPVLALAFQPDGKAIASGGKDPLVRLWNVGTGKEERHWIGHLGWVRALAFTKDGATLVSGSHDSAVKAWDPAQASGPQVIAAHGDWVQALALHDGHGLLASGARDGSIKLWSAGTGKLLLKLPSVQGAVTSLTFSAHPDKPYLAAGTRDDKSEGQITVWQLESDKQTWTSKEKHAFKDHKKGITALAFAPTVPRADLLVSGSADSSVILWDLATGKAKETYRGHKDEVRSVAFGPDSRTFVSGGKDRQACIYELDRKDFTTLPDVQMQSIETVATLAFKGGDGAVIAGGSDHTVRIWVSDATDVKARHEIRVIRAHHQPVSAVIYRKNNNQALFVTSSWDGTIKLHDTFGERFTLLGHVGPVRALALAADQSFLASAGHDGTIRIWRTATERTGVPGFRGPESK